jgi:hypothetical protein
MDNEVRDQLARHRRRGGGMAGEADVLLIGGDTAPVEILPTPTSSSICRSTRSPSS